MDPINIITITVDNNFVSVFSQEIYERSVRGEMILTDRINAQNLRLRESASGYTTDWHIAGDPTLIIVRQGTLRITLQNGEFKDFHTGDQFIAKDYLPNNISFDLKIHGHKAEVMGKDVFKAVHIKLSPNV